MSFWDEERELGRVENGNQTVVIKEVVKSGKKMVDIRKWFMDKKTDELKPTRKGVALPLDIMEEIKKVL